MCMVILMDASAHYRDTIGYRREPMHLARQFSDGVLHAVASQAAPKEQSIPNAFFDPAAIDTIQHAVAKSR